MDEFQRCWVVGAGAVGSAIGGVLQRAKRVEIHLVGRSIHAQTIQAKGLSLEIVGEPPSLISLLCHVPDEVPVLGEGDVVLMTGKVPSLENTCAWLRERSNPSVPVVVLQNGLGPEQIVAEALGRAVDRGLVFFGANSPSPGTVRYFPGVLRLRESKRIAALCPLFEGTPIRCEMIEDFKKTEWLKLAINCIANSFAGVLRINNRQITSQILDPAKDAILEEVRAVARADGAQIHIASQDINHYLNQENIPSLRTDLERGWITEIDVLNGAVSRMGRRYGIRTPANDLVASMVKFLESKGLSSPTR